MSSTSIRDIRDPRGVPGLRLLSLGGGNMAQALLSGLLARPELGLQQLTIVEPLVETRERLEGLLRQPAEATGVRLEIIAALAAHPVDRPDWLLLAIKPQQVAAAFEALSADDRSWLHQARLLSVVAGLTTEQLSRQSGLSEVVRSMPNTPALIGEGMTGLYATPSCSEQTRQQAEAMMGAVGQVAWFEEESKLDAVTALSGSGPAYLFRFVEALAAAGESLGLTADQARQLATQTMKGAALMLAASHEGPAVLRERVTSKGGTTAAALAVFNGETASSEVHTPSDVVPVNATAPVAALDDLVKRALTAARDRSEALSRG